MATVPSTGNDTITGTQANDSISALAGNDIVYAGGGDDTVHGDAGNDNLFGQDGNDHLWGDAGNDNIDGGAGTDYAHYSGNQSQYQITTANGVTEIKDLRGNGSNTPDGIDQLTNVERLVFADGVKLLVPDRAPQAVNDKAFTAADTATDIDVRANDSDPDGDPLRIASLSDADPTAPGVQSAMGATISIVNGQVHYDATTSQVLQAVPHFHTVDDSFTYTVDDGFGGSATAMVDVIVAGLNHPPASGFLRVPPINQYQTIDINVAGVATDPDGDFVSVIVPFDADPTRAGIQTDKGATISLLNNEVHYDPTTSATLQALNAGQFAADTFSVGVFDGFGGGGLWQVQVDLIGIGPVT